MDLRSYTHEYSLRSYLVTLRCTRAFTVVIQCLTYDLGLCQVGASKNT
jgi:hypothetical protein